MEIRTEQDMREFCEQVRKRSSEVIIFRIWDVICNSTVRQWEDYRDQYDPYPGAELKQGIAKIGFGSFPEGIELCETPKLHPFAKTPEDKPDLKGAMTGVLVNCWDLEKKLTLLQLRGKKIESEHTFQNAAAGFGRFRRPLHTTALIELEQEAGIAYPASLWEKSSLDFLPFMAGGYPQPLASFTFANDLSRFEVCRDMDSVLEFREHKLKDLSLGKLEKKEGYHFTVPYSAIEEIAGKLNDANKFYGPVYDSIINSLRTLRNTADLP